MDPVEPQADGLAAMASSPAAAHPAEAVLDAAQQAGAIAPDSGVTDTPEQVRASVQRWWAVTNNVPDFTESVAQVEKDLETILGKKDENEDDSIVTVNHVYRNALQTVALTVPEGHSFRWKPKRMAPSPDPTAVIDDGGDPNVVGLGATLEIVTMRYTEEIELQETLEAWVQDSTHFRCAVLKVTFQRNLETDALQEERLPDGQDDLALLRHLLERYARGEFDKTTSEWHDVQRLMNSLGRGQIMVWQGLVIENVPLKRFRMDPRISAPENCGAAGWESHDVLMTRAEILSKWSKVKAEDLGRATTYVIDSAGKEIKQEARDRTTSTGTIRQMQTPGTAPGQKGTDDEALHLVREVWDRGTNTVFCLVEGLEYPACEWTPERPPSQWFPFVPLVLNRVPGRFYGLSDTELQAKIQRAINRKRTREEESRTAALPRFAYNTSKISAETAKRITDAKPWEGIPIDGGSEDIRKDILPLVGNHEHNPLEHDTTPDKQELREMSSLPEQAVGITGNAKFSSEVNAAVQGASILTRFRQGRIKRALRKVYDMIGQILLQEVAKPQAIAMAGQYAVWPDAAPEREQLYRELSVDVEIGIDGMLDRQQRIGNLTQILEALAKMGLQAQPEPAAKLLGRLLGEEEVMAQLVKADPNALIGRLMQAIESSPGALQKLDPRAALALAQLGQAATAQLVQQQAAAQAARQAQAAPGAAGAPTQPAGPAPAAPMAAPAV